MFYIHTRIERVQLSHDTYSDPRIEYAGHDVIHDHVDTSDRYSWVLSAWSLQPFVTVVLYRDTYDRPMTQVFESRMMPMIEHSLLSPST